MKVLLSLFKWEPIESMLSHQIVSPSLLQDIASKIMAFSQQGPRTVCILSANGAICNVTLRQPAMSGGSVTYEVLLMSVKSPLLLRRICF
jgi:hypothetical protein